MQPFRPVDRVPLPGGQDPDVDDFPAWLMAEAEALVRAHGGLDPALRLATPDAFVVRPGQVERWLVRRGLPCSTDDVQRNLVGPSGAVGVALIHPTVVMLGHEILHALVFMAEASGRRAGVTVPVRVDAEGRRTALRGVGFRAGSPGPDGWIGVAPGMKLDLAPVVGPVN